MKKVKKIIVLGSGGNSRDIVDTINDINEFFGETYQCLGFLDDAKDLWGKEIFGLKVLGPIEDAVKFNDCYFVNGVYSVINFFNNEDVIKRSRIPDSRFVTIVHPSANVSKTAKIGKGTVLLRDVIVMSDVVLGKHVCIHPSAIISHDTKIGDFSFVANMASIGGYVKITGSCFIGANSALRDRIKLGRYCIIGMGSAVIRDVPDNSVFVGNPARFLRKSRK